MEPCGLSKGDDSLKAWGGWAFHMRTQVFSVCPPNSGHKPTPPCNLPHVSSDLLLKIELLVPTFQFRGRRENGRNSSAFKRNSSFNEHTWKVKRLRPSRALNRTCTFGSWVVPDKKPRVALYVYSYRQTSKGRLACSNILQHFNELLLSSDVGQVGDNNPLYLHTTKMSHGQITLLDSAVFEPHWIEMWVIKQLAHTIKTQPQCRLVSVNWYLLKMHIYMDVSNYVVCCNSNWRSDARVSEKVWIKNNKAKGWRNPLGKIRFAGANKCGSLTGSCLMHCTVPSSNWQHVTGKSKSQYLLYLRSCASAGSSLHDEQSTGQREATEKAKRKTAPSLMLYAPC